jgi:segregation and condensation protein A
MEASLSPVDTAGSDASGPPWEQPTGQPQVRDPERFRGHRVRLRIFEGPLDLLLYLIRAHRYDVFDIPVAAVTGQFLEFLQVMEELDLEYAGDFLVTAATLMQIKARMLLPQHESVNEDEMDEGKNDPRQELVERLLEYQKFQGAADTLRDLREERARTFTRPAVVEGLNGLDGVHALPDVEADGALLLQDISTFDLLRALKKVLDRVAERPVALVRRETFSLAERVRDLLHRVRATDEGVSFGALCEDCETRLEVVVTFLALLELISRQHVRVTQRKLFDEIWVCKA